MKNTTTRIECSGCDRFFATNSAFVAHRIGNIQKGEARHCMTAEDLAAHGFATEQKYVNLPRDGRPVWHEQAVWYDVAGREKMRGVFSDLPKTAQHAIPDVL